MNPRDFLTQASDLLDGSREADWRSAASRAYYAVFHIARNLLRHAGFRVPDAARAHSYLALRLQNCGKSLIQKAGEDLETLRDWRNKADYDLHIPFAEVVGVTAYNLAHDTFQLLEDLLGEPMILAEVTATIREYERAVLVDVTWAGP